MDTIVPNATRAMEELLTGIKKKDKRKDKRKNISFNEVT